MIVVNNLQNYKSPVSGKTGSSIKVNVCCEVCLCGQYTVTIHTIIIIYMSSVILDFSLCVASCMDMEKLKGECIRKE